MATQGTLGLPRTFYPALAGGKYHQANKIVETALCSSAILLDVNAAVISYSANEMFANVHAIVCRKCLTKSTGRN